MIQITDMNGRRHYLHLDAIARVAQAGPNWHGIRAYVKTFDGKTIEAAESADEIQQAIQLARRPPHTNQTSLIAHITAFIASDALAISYQSLGEYRTALLRMLREAQTNTEGA
ncbi:hypothetical protein [Alcaligenes sp. SDU_A2]|uniref:hypothetical protein n=1 Tax=Alcaligenes sp. SDU_A2 TaxID=3136634 RepID=UPI00311F65D7